MPAFCHCPQPSPADGVSHRLCHSVPSAGKLNERGGMRSRPTATAHDIGDLINAMPTMFGFPPQDSLVGLGLDGKRVCFGMRLDLADVADVEKTADYVVRHLQNQVAGSGID